MDETADSWAKWKKLFDCFTAIRDVRYGNFLHFPFSGGYYEQPEKTMEVLEIIRGLYLEKLADEMTNSTSSITV
jgi:hypothetical protein